MAAIWSWSARAIPRPRGRPPRGAKDWSEENLELLARPGLELTPKTLVVFDVTRSLDARRVEVALEFSEQLLVALAQDVNKHVQAAAVRHAHYRMLVPMVDGRAEQGVEGGMADSAPSRPNRFWPMYLVSRNRSRASAALSLARIWRCSSGSRSVLTPSTCCWIQRFCSGAMMCMYSTPTVRQYASRRNERISPSRIRLPGQALGQELPVEVPYREAVSAGVELGVHLWFFPVERVEVGDQVAPHPVGIYEPLDFLLLFYIIGRRLERVVDVPAVPDGLIRHAHRTEHAFVKAVLAQQEPVDTLKEQAGLCPLYYPVVISRAEA